MKINILIWGHLLKSGHQYPCMWEYWLWCW